MSWRSSPTPRRSCAWPPPWSSNLTTNGRSPAGISPMSPWTNYVPSSPPNTPLQHWTNNTKSPSVQQDSLIATREPRRDPKSTKSWDAIQPVHDRSRPALPAVDWHDRRDFHRNGQPSNEARDTVGCAYSTTVGPLASMPYHPPPPATWSEPHPHVSRFYRETQKSACPSATQATFADLETLLLRHSSRG